MLVNRDLFYSVIRAVLDVVQIWNGVAVVRLSPWRANGQEEIISPLS